MYGLTRVRFLFDSFFADGQDFLQKALANKDAKKKMSPTNAKALNSMRQRLRKHNLMYADQIESFRENPVSSDVDASGDEDAESSEESGASKQCAFALPVAVSILMPLMSCLLHLL